MTERLERQEEENEIDLGSFFELAERNKILYNQVPVNTLMKDTKNLKNGFFTISYFTLGDKREIDTNRFFGDSSELANFLDKILDKYEDHRSEFYTGNFYR